MNCKVILALSFKPRSLYIYAAALGELKSRAASVTRMGHHRLHQDADGGLESHMQGRGSPADCVGWELGTQGLNPCPGMTAPQDFLSQSQGRLEFPPSDTEFLSPSLSEHLNINKGSDYS